MITALKLLSKGGNFIIKMFTFFEDFSINLLYVLNCCFVDVHVFKPITSKEGNSEVYVIALDYLETQNMDIYLDKIFDNLNNDKYSLFSLSDLPDTFLQQVLICSKYFMRLQIEVIENNIRFYEFFNKRENYRIRMLRSTIQEEYFRLYKLKSISDSNKIISSDNPKILYNFNNLNPRAHSGSYTERKNLEENMCKDDKIQILGNKLYDFYQTTNMYDDSKLLDLKIDSVLDDNVSITLAKPIEKIASSKFVLVAIIKFLLNSIDCTAQVNLSHQTILTCKNNNKIIISMYAFRDLNSNYDQYEKDIILKIIDFILLTLASPSSADKNHILSIDNLLLLTQFSVGFVYFLKQNVANSMKFTKNGKILIQHFKSDEAGNNLEMLKQIIVDSKTLHKNKSIIGLFNIKNLFVTDFYNCIIEYNNYVCLKYCSQYLNLKLFMK